MNRTLLLKAIADETRMKILTLLLQHNYCVCALAKTLHLTEATISQHLKVLREAGLLIGEKRGYFMHYDVKRDVLRGLAAEIQKLADIKRESCTQEKDGRKPVENQKFHAKIGRSKETKAFYHGKTGGGR